MTITVFGNTTKRFLAWVDRDGPRAAGLSQQARRQITISGHMFVAEAEQLGDDLKHALKLWNALHVDGHLGENNLLQNLTILQMYLTSADDQMRSVIHSAGDLSNSANATEASLSTAVAENEHSMVSIHAQISSLNMQIAAQRVVLKHANEELEGSKGFLTGFLTGITLGIYNGIRKNRDDAKTAIASINAAIKSIQTKAKLCNAKKNEIHIGKVAIGALVGVPDAMGRCRNTLTQGLKSIESARSKLEKADGKSSPVVKALLKSATPKMNELQRWANALDAL